MKLSAKTLNAARKAAIEQGMTVDEWADKILFRAASAKQSPDMEAMLRDISRKIDQIAEHRHVGDRVNDQVGSAIEEIGASFTRIRKTTGRVFDKVRTQAGTAVGEVAGKAHDAFDQTVKSATALVAPVPAPPAETIKPRRKTAPVRKPEAKNRKPGPKPGPATKGKRGN